MNTQKFNILLSKIDQDKIFIDTSNKIEPFHIYFKLKEFYKDKITSAESLSMYVHHLKLEKCLSELRKRNTEGSVFLLSEVEKLDRKFPIFLQNGMDSLYLAMLAYSDYILYEDCEKALYKLRLSIEKGILQSMNFPFFCLSIPTQWINILRILANNVQKEAAIEEIINLLKFILFGIHIDNDFSKTYHGLGETEHDFVISDVFDNIIYSLEKNFGYETMREILNITTSEVLSMSSNCKAYNNSVVSILSIINNQSSFIDNLYAKVGLLTNIPKSLQRIVLDDFRRIYQNSHFFLNHSIESSFT
jgi:hypothetical protein